MGIIDYGKSEYTSPILLHKKPSELNKPPLYRVLADFRHLNSKISKQNYQCSGKYARQLVKNTAKTSVSFT